MIMQKVKSNLMDNSEKLKFMVKKFGMEMTAEYIDNSKNIDKAFKQSLYAEFVVDSWLEKTKEISKMLITYKLTEEEYRELCDISDDILSMITACPEQFIKPECKPILEELKKYSDRLITVLHSRK